MYIMTLLLIIFMSVLTIPDVSLYILHLLSLVFHMGPYVSGSLGSHKLCNISCCTCTNKWFSSSSSDKATLRLRKVVCYDMPTLYVWKKKYSFVPTVKHFLGWIVPK